MIVGNAKKRQRVSINDDDNIAMNIYFQSGMRQVAPTKLASTCKLVYTGYHKSDL